MPPLPPNITKAGILHSKSGWNNSSLSRRSGTTSGLAEHPDPAQLGQLGRWDPKPVAGDWGDPGGDAAECSGHVVDGQGSCFVSTHCASRLAKCCERVAEWWNNSYKRGTAIRSY